MKKRILSIILAVCMVAAMVPAMQTTASFVNLALFDDRTALSYLSVLAGDFFLGAYPLARFIIEYASGGGLYIRLGK